MASGVKIWANRKVRMLAILGGLAGALAGCESVGETSSEFAKTVIAGGQEPVVVSQDTFAGPVYCPPIQLQRNSFLIMKFARGSEDDPAGLMYQATIEDWAKSCTVDPSGETRIKIGLRGDVTPGPAWKGGDVTLPVRIAIVPTEDGAKPVISELIKLPVSVAEGAPSVGWAFVEDKFLVPANTELKILFGFDEGGRR